MVVPSLVLKIVALKTNEFHKYNTPLYSARNNPRGPLGWIDTTCQTAGKAGAGSSGVGRFRAAHSVVKVQKGAASPLTMSENRSMIVMG